ncbi:MAG: thermostable hemolysin delta-VPH [Oscillospiraceae bacterium]
MGYFNYHATAKKLIADGKLIGWYYAKKHNKISPALVLMFDDTRHCVMPIRKEKWWEYELLLPAEKQIFHSSLSP